MAGIQMKQELFDGVFDGKTDTVHFRVQPLNL